MKFEAVMFDLDGLLIDSEVYWGDAKKTIWGRLDFSDTEREEINKKMQGRNMTDTVAIMQAAHPHLEAEYIRSVFHDAADDIYRKQANLMPGAAMLLQRVKEAVSAVALVSSSNIDWVEASLKKCGVREFFTDVLSAEGLGMPGKPAPDVYIHSMKKLNVIPERTVILEDTFVGLSAGKGSGAAVIAVPDPRWSFGDFSSADLVAKTLQDPRIYEFLGFSI